MQSQVISKIWIKKNAFLIDGYAYRVEVYRSIDGGNSFYFCGTQKLAKNITEAKRIRAGLSEKERCII